MLNYLVRTYLIFIFYTLLLTLFGYGFVYILQKINKKKWNLSLLEKLFVSYGVGILIFIEISYIASYFGKFNFFTILLPLLLVDLFILYLIFPRRKIKDIKTYLQTFKIKNHLNQVQDIILILIVFLCQFLLLWPIISSSSALLAYDPYLWVNDVLYLISNGRVNDIQRNYQGYTYPWGFIFICSGNVLISPDFATIYYFMKLCPFPFLNWYLLLIYSLGKRFIKWPSLVFLSLLLVLINRYFLYRTIMFLSSSLAILLILIIFLIIITNIPNWLIGFMLPGIILINPIYSIFAMLLIIIFHGLRLIVSYKKFFTTIKDFFGIGILTLVFLIPYVLIFILLYGKGIEVLIKNFIWLFKNPEKGKLKLLVEFRTIFLMGPLIYQQTNTSGMELITFYSSELLFYIVNMDFLFYIAFLGLFIFERGQDQITKDFIYLIKIGYVLVSSIWFIPIFLQPNIFLEIFIIRMYEAFFPCIIFLTVYFLKVLVEKIKKVFMKEDIFSFNDDEFL